MPTGEYPFIQIAVHPAVRDRFAGGEALAVLSTDLGFVYWSNGSAARQFGYDTIYAFLEDEDFADTVTARQIATAAAQLSPARPRQSLVLRLGSGFRRFAAACTLERITLPDGEDALLLAMPADRKLKDALARAEALIDGFGDTETHVAVVDGEANTLAQSMTFGPIGLDPAVLEAMIADVDREESRLVKRAVPTAKGAWPAAIARLSQALYLVFVVEPAEPAAGDVPAEPHPEPGKPAPAPPAAENAETPPAAPEAPRPETKPDFVFDPAGRPVRFVWKIDAAGRFSELSPEFSDAVGPYAADAIGRTFEDLSQVFNLDRDGVIAELLRRRDTWSGKTVLWPVQGEALSVPVDLAALPTYSRDRMFDGFRGFGIVRIADAVADPEKIGLALVPEPVDFAETAGVADVPLPESPPETPEATDALPAGAPEAPVPPAGERPTVPPTPANSDGPASAAPSSPDHAGDAASGPSDDRVAEDPFRGEVPALRLVPTPARPRSSDKVIDLSEHRRGGREGLSKSDQAVFREIGQELGRKLAETEARGPDAGAEPVPADMDDVGTESVPTEPAPAPLPDAEPVAGVTLARAEPAAEAVEVVAEPIAEAEPVSAVALVPAVPTVDDGDAGREDIDSSFAEDVEDAAEIAPGRARLTRTLVDNLPLPLLIHRGDSLLHANAEFLALAGCASLADLDAAGGIGSLFEHPGEMTLEMDARPGTLSLITASGAAVPVTARLQSVGWESGHALMLALSPQAVAASPQPVDDDAAAHSASLSIAMVEVQELRSILETATDGVVILDEGGAIRSMNRSASALFDYDDAETKGRPFAMLFAHESQRAVIDYVTGLSDNGVASVLNDGREVIGREASGGFIPLFMTIGRLTGSNGYCAVIRDITHWKRTEEELRGAKRAAETASGHKSDFLARVSHEIRTPLNAIIGFAEMMATERFGPLGSPRYQEYAHDIGRSGRHVLDIVNDLLDISKIEAGQQEMDFTAVSLNEALAETVSLLQPQANGQRVIIRTSLSTTLPDVVADLRSIKQIAINLLSNAIRFTPAGGQIVVSTAYEASGRVIVRVRDTGTGMSRAELDQAMKPFKQASSGPARPRGDGTGLGLPLTKAMVEANRAQFSIESAPGEGTLVQIAFPSQRVLAD